MANTKQAKKQVRKTKVKTAYNRWWKTKVKEAVKALMGVASSDTTERKAKISQLQKTIDKAAKNGVIKKNKARRMKSQASKKSA
jgi:small subunit ribosomal protein S20